MTALALDLLGVPRDAIEADYQMSGPEVERVLAFWAKRGWFSDAQTDQIVGVHPGVISGFLDAVDARYGSSEGYLLGIGVSGSPSTGSGGRWPVSPAIGSAGGTPRYRVRHGGRRSTWASFSMIRL